MTDETKIYITMKVNFGNATKTFYGWLESGDSKAETSEPKTLSVTEKPIFPDHYAKNLQVTEESDHWRIIITKFLGKDDFGSVLAIVKEYGGSYFAKGSPEKAHFKIPKVTEVNK